MCRQVSQAYLILMLLGLSVQLVSSLYHLSELTKHSRLKVLSVFRCGLLTKKCKKEHAIVLYFNPIQPGKEGWGWGGGRVQSEPPPCNFKAIEATAKGLKGCTLCPKLFCLRVAKWTNNVLSRFS